MSNGIEILYYINTKNIQLFKTLQLELIIQPDKKTQEKNKMKKNITELLLIIDESGSMFSLRQETIGELNAFIKAL